MTKEADDGVDGATKAAVTPPSTTAFLNLSAYMYMSYDTPYSSTPLQADIDFAPLMKNGKPVIMIDNKNGVYAEAFVSTAPGPKQVVLGFEGTHSYYQGNEFTAGQLTDDLQLYSGKKVDFFHTVASDTRKVVQMAENRGIAKKDVFVTGHSLGAAEAEYAAAKTGLGGEAFAGPGINVNYTRGRTPKIADYVDAGDPVGNYAADGNYVLGPVLVSDKIKHYGNLDVLPNSDGYATLQTAAQNYANTIGNARGLTVIGAILSNGQYHEISQYASDLDVPLYLTDASVGADNGFFGAAATGSSAGAESNGAAVPTASTASSSTLSSTLASQVAQLGSQISASFAAPSSGHGGSVITDAHATTPTLAAHARR